MMIDLDRKAVGHDRGKFRQRHLEAAIAADRDDQFVGARHLCADCGRNAEAHGTQTAGIDPEARFVEADQLRGPHLVLADVRGHDGLAAGEPVDFIHQMLRTDDALIVTAVIRMLFHPAANLVPPRAAGIRVCRAHFGLEFLHRFVISFCSTRFTSPTIGISGVRFLPTSAGSIST